MAKKYDLKSESIIINQSINWVESSNLYIITLFYNASYQKRLYYLIIPTITKDNVVFTFSR